jgi:hypothetical protein
VEPQQNRISEPQLLSGSDGAASATTCRLTRSEAIRCAIYL